MATKNAKARDDEDDDRDDEDEDDDPDAGVPVPAGQSVKAQPSKTAKSAPARAHASPKVSHGDHGKGHGGHAKDAHGHDDAIDDEAQDPSWWTPYAVLGAIVVIGVLGFFGAFSSLLKPMFSPPKLAPEHEEAAPAQAAEPAAPAPAAPEAAADADTFGAKHLLVMYKGSKRAPPTIERSKEEALARAKEAMAKAKAPGAKFEDLVAEYSDEPGAAKRGGNLGNFRRGAMVKEFQDALDKMKVGDVSDVVETPFGYHVIVRTK
jgi:hypothetical protein